MWIDDAFLDYKLPTSNRYLFGILSRHAAALLERLEGSRTTKGQVERLLIPMLHKGDIGMDTIARELGTSRQTLYRRLKAEGVTYKEVVDSLRREMALHYLRGKKVSVNEVAYLVGYSETSAFSRAFQRWTGMRPSAES